MEKGSITLKTIAEHFNVSVNTVSRALRDKSGVSEKLRIKIKTYAEENHYASNLYARGLRGEGMNLIGLILADNYNPAYFDELRAIEEGAEELGYQIVLSNSQENIAVEKKHLRVMAEKRVDGILIAPCGYAPGEPANDYSLLEQMGIPFVLMHRYIKGKDYDCVKFDNVSTGIMGVQYLFSKGHKRILHIMPDSENTSVEDRFNGFRLAYLDAGMDLPEELILRCNISKMEEMESAIGRRLDQGGDYTAILTYNDLMAITTEKILYKRGIRIPEDIAVMGTDDISYSDLCLTPLTTIQHSSYELGKRALRLLKAKMEGKRIVSPVIENVGPELVERESV